MPNFSATYTNRSGQTRTLQLQASDPARARRELRRRGIVPSSLKVVTAKPAATSTVFGMDVSSLLEAKPGIREKPSLPTSWRPSWMRGSPSCAASI